MIFHRLNITRGRSALLSTLAQLNPSAWLSYHPELWFVTTKWGAEACLREGERLGIAVLRPETFLVSRLDTDRELKEVGAHVRLIFKPDEGSRGNGILISTPATFDAVLETIRTAAGRTGNRFVVQKMVEDAVTVEGRRFDLRLYAAVQSFRPLRYRVYRDGIVRVAARPQSASDADPLAILTNCAYRAKRGETLDNLTVEELLHRLRSDGHEVDDVWSRIDAVAGQVFQCFATWEPLGSAPEISRLFLIAGLDLMLVDRGAGLEPLFIEANYTPLLHGFGPSAVEHGLHETTRQWLSAVLARAQEPAPSARLKNGSRCDRADCSHRDAFDFRERPSTSRSTAGIESDGGIIHLPAVDGQPARSAVAAVLDCLKKRGSDSLTMGRLPSVLNSVVAREMLLGELSGVLRDREGVLSVRSGEPALAGFEMRARRTPGGAVLDFVVRETADLRSLTHPLAEVLPTVGGRHCMVDTRLWPDARIEYLDPYLVGPSVNGAWGKERQSLLHFLGRTIVEDGRGEALGRRYVEPGVGRSYLVDYLRLEDQPELRDFSVLGVGLTPYSAGGFAMTGPYVDGLTSVQRALHRHKCALRLAEAGCRVARTAAIITLPGLETTMPDETRAPAALIVRGFRLILRVKQLDPLACLFDSLQHRAGVISFLLNPAWDPADGSGRSSPLESATGWERWSRSDHPLRNALCHLACKRHCLRHVVGSTADESVESTEYDRSARARRLKVIHSYGPCLLELAKTRLARETGRYLGTAPLSTVEYVHWFAEQLGLQLAIMKKMRFLHDYHQPGVSRTTPTWIYTLCETNVTLLAEFADLDTGVFVDRSDSATLDELVISRADFQLLHDEFDAFHQRDLSAAEQIVRTVAGVAARGDTADVSEAAAHFTRVYSENALRAATVSLAH